MPASPVFHYSNEFFYSGMRIPPITLVGSTKHPFFGADKNNKSLPTLLPFCCYGSVNSAIKRLTNFYHCVFSCPIHLEVYLYSSGYTVCVFVYNIIGLQGNVEELDSGCRPSPGMKVRTMMLMMMMIIIIIIIIIMKMITIRKMMKMIVMKIMLMMMMIMRIMVIMMMMLLIMMMISVSLALGLHLYASAVNARVRCWPNNITLSLTAM